MNHYNPTESPIGSLLLGDPLALAHLLPALMKFYVDVEHTGLSSQFHDKFNVRYNIALLFKILWNHNEHRLRLSEQAKNMSFFVKFVNLLMNDTTHLLFEALSKLSEIHSIQTEMSNLEQWNAESQEHREQRLETLHTDERQAGSYVALSNENVAMLGYLTLENRRPFLSEEIVDRLAAMLNYTLSGLVGPKCTELKVNNPEKYQFNPKKLLGSLMDIYLNLESERFIKAMANDQRSFKVSYFDRAINILGKFGLKNPSYLDRLRQLVNKVEVKVKDLQMEDEILQDFPSEFEDPLMSTLMRNPVKLPTSGITIDLSTIKSHLLSDNTDPFNRQPLTIDMVVPDHELKARIEAFIEERLSKK
jgi:ubiquitin conjugation factor E4 B